MAGNIVKNKKISYNRKCFEIYGDKMIFIPQTAAKLSAEVG
jgi:hypothetical protein